MRTLVPKKFSILIVDDNPKNLQVLGKFLQEEKNEIEFAINGEAALEWLNNKQFDLVLLDINMPGMNGFEVCKKIRSNGSFYRIPVIFLSSENERESILKGFEVGAQDYVIKPFDKRELLARVKTHLAIKESREKLEEMNLSLEEKVKGNTLQLTEVNKRLEKANLQLNELDKAKSEFLQMISHRIRTPLNGIVGPLYLMKEEEKSGDLIALVEILDQSVNRLEKFSLNALLITQLRTQGEKISKENILISDLINKCLVDSEIKNLLNSKKIDLKVSDLLLEKKIFGNFELLGTAVTNVLENSIKYSFANSIVHLTIKAEDKSTVLELVDNGPGFPKKSVSTINNMLSSDELIINPDLGLGLNLVKLIMSLHSGKVEVENRDKGACVKLFFI